MTTSSKAQTYAGVVFEAALEDWLGSLRDVGVAIDRSPGLQTKLASASIPFPEKQEVLAALLPQKMAVPVRNFLMGMLANGDIALLDEVVDELTHMAAAAGGPRPTRAEVTSAVELTDTERQDIQNRLSDEFGANLEFRFAVDPKILGGLIIRVGDKLIDTSVASRLAGLRQSLGVASS